MSRSRLILFFVVLLAAGCSGAEQTTVAEVSGNLSGHADALCEVTGEVAPSSSNLVSVGTTRAFWLSDGDASLLVWYRSTHVKFDADAGERVRVVGKTQWDPHAERYRFVAKEVALAR